MSTFVPRTGRKKNKEFAKSRWIIIEKILGKKMAISIFIQGRGTMITKHKKFLSCGKLRQETKWKNLCQQKISRYLRLPQTEIYFNKAKSLKITLIQPKLNSCKCEILNFLQKVLRIFVLKCSRSKRDTFHNHILVILQKRDRTMASSL